MENKDILPGNVILGVGEAHLGVHADSDTKVFGKDMKVKSETVLNICFSAAHYIIHT